MTDAGLFVWKQTNRGLPTMCKIDLEMHRHKMASNAEYKTLYNALLIKDYRLTEEEWKLSLDQLAEKYPCPVIPSSPS